MAEPCKKAAKVMLTQAPHMEAMFVFFHQVLRHQTQKEAEHLVVLPHGYRMNNGSAWLDSDGDEEMGYRTQRLEIPSGSGIRSQNS